jgi:hypothetical protein
MPASPSAHPSAVAPADPLVHCFWEDLSPRARAVVEVSAAPIAAALTARAWWAIRNCDLACAAWARAFRAAGVPVKVMSGNYYLGDDAEARAAIGELPTASEHTWLLVDGAIFDPTAGQFLTSGPIRPEGYRPERPATRRPRRPASPAHRAPG